MKISWGIKIAILYVGFMGLIITLVVASSKQHFDLVSKDYYSEEVAYQKVIDAGKNQSELAAPISLHADAGNVIVDFPAELKDKAISGTIQFYSPVNSAWDQNMKVELVNNSMSIPRSKLRNTRYVIKISADAGGKKYYQETEINLHS